MLVATLISGLLLMSAVLWRAVPTAGREERSTPYPRGAPAETLVQELPSHPGDEQPEEGVDFAVERTPDGEVVAWSCDEPILVATHGVVPSGAQAALEEVVTLVADSSGLPLVVGDPGSKADITVYYAALGTARGGIEIKDEDALGLGGAYFRGAQIIRGTVIVRDDLPSTHPGTDAGRAVLAHELLHSLGLGHVERADQLMAPVIARNPSLSLGAGDRAGLTLVGCPRL